MTHLSHPSRRALLGLAAAGMSLAYAGRAAAQAQGPSNKLIFLIARGAMDGLSVTVPYQDPAYAALRGGLALPPPGQTGGVLPLEQGFGLHPALSGLHQAYGAGGLRFAPAVAIPARSRSHFDAQDLLESGGADLGGADDGWLNRALAAAGGGRLKGLSIGAQTPLVMRGRAKTSSWSPGGRTRADDRVVSLLQDLYVDDPLLGPSLARGLETEALASALGGDQPTRRNDAAELGRAVARLMTGQAGADVVALSVDGWDTHARQAPQMNTRLEGLDALIGGLREGLGQDWARTVLVVATEFGRTARTNGTLGTDHGTGSSLLLTGGAIRAGGLVGDWPTLAEPRLFEGRDLAPTLDVRAVFKGVLRDHLGVDRAALDGVVFPGSRDQAPPVEGLVG